MKKILYFLSITLFSSFLFSEEYVCSIELSSLDRPGEMEIKTYERNNKDGYDYFLKYIKDREPEVWFILSENEFQITLYKTYSDLEYPYVYLCLIEKQTKTFLEKIVTTWDIYLQNYSPPLTGQCIVK